MTTPIPRVYPHGPEDAKILIVGEFPTAVDVKTGKPFSDYDGQELTRMLHEAGIMRESCRLTTVCPIRPPKSDITQFFLTKTEGNKRGLAAVGGKYPTEEIRAGLQELAKEVARAKPKTIIALGNVALWALTGEWGISKWRGSELTLQPVWDGPFDPSIRVIPTYSPAMVMRTWEWRPVTCYDLRRAGQTPVPEPTWDFQIIRTFEEARIAFQFFEEHLSLGPTLLSCDIETREKKFIDCIGIGVGSAAAFCFPIFKASSYEFLWTPEEEADIILGLRRILLHPNAKIVGQNFYYDATYIARLWGFLVQPFFDTMIGHAVAYPGTQKSLDYLSSIYLPWHRYWKDDTAEAEAEADDEKRWLYNCKDCAATWALYAPIAKTLDNARLQNQWWELKRKFLPLMNMMLRGVKQDKTLNSTFMEQVLLQQGDLEHFFEDLGTQAWPDLQLAKSKTAKPWYRSPTQQVKLFYYELLLPPQYHKKTRRPTTDDAALSAIGKAEPLFKPLTDALGDYRSLGVFLSTFLLMALDHDKRFRTSYNPVGTETFRFNSGQDPFGFGGNLQNIPKGDG